MNFNIFIIIVAAILIFCVVAIIVDSKGRGINKIKSTRLKNGPYGDTDWANNKEICNYLTLVKFEPERWRVGENLPEIEGTILGTYKKGGELYAYLDKEDNHTMIIAAPSAGKTTSLIYPNLEYAAAVGMSTFNTDTKGTMFRDYVPIFKKYGAKTNVFDLRYPNQSDCFNFMGLVNKYMDLYHKNGSLADYAKSVAYAKNMARVIIHMEGFKTAGQNQFFYDTAEAVISAITLLVTEFSPNAQRHIVSVFKIIRQLIEVDPATVGKKDVQPQLYLQQLYKDLPENHISKDLLATPATADYKTLSNILGTAMSKLLSFIDPEIEQLICFDSDLDIEEFTKGNYAVFFVVDEKFGTRNFIVNLMIKEIYGECIRIADKSPRGRLPVRVYFNMDEVGTYDTIENFDSMLSASRSRNILINPSLQTSSQLVDKYGQHKAQTIENCCQNVMFSYQAPLSSDAQRFEKAIGTQTVKSGSVTIKSGNGNSNSSTTYSMVKQPLMFAYQITTKLRKGEWVLRKIGMNPAQMKLLKAEDWGITFEKEPYEIPSKADRKVEYASRAELMTEVRKKYKKHYYPDELAPLPSAPTVPERVNQSERTINPDYFN